MLLAYFEGLRHEVLRGNQGTEAVVELFTVSVYCTVSAYCTVSVYFTVSVYCIVSTDVSADVILREVVYQYPKKELELTTTKKLTHTHIIT